MKDERTCWRAERGRFITNSVHTIGTHPDDSMTSLIPKYLLLLSVGLWETQRAEHACF